MECPNTKIMTHVSNQTPRCFHRMSCYTRASPHLAFVDDSVASYSHCLSDPHSDKIGRVITIGLHQAFADSIAFTVQVNSFIVTKVSL